MIYPTTNEGMDDWMSDQDVKYTLVAKVNDVVAYSLETSDPEVVVGQVRHAEEQVAMLLNDQYVEATTPDYDAWAEDERMLNGV